MSPFEGQPEEDLDLQRSPYLPDQGVAVKLDGTLMQHLVCRFGVVFTCGAPSPNHPILHVVL
jgi:hypothetical protein